MGQGEAGISWTAEDRERIVRSLQGDVLKYAQHKFASNVIKKCVVFGTTEQRNALIDQRRTGSRLCNSP
uniref:SANT domain-containing protein n=1 Tax=Globodera pallida TaxID=36090 RepID=A0A183C267_GLOPA